MWNKDQLKAALICGVLALGTLALYAPAFGFDFLKYDDQLYVVNNPHVNTGLRWQNITWAFQAGYASNWHPLTWISLMVDSQIHGLKPGGFHATNVILHALNAALLFLAFRRLTGALWRSAIVAALFAWHPLHVESVAWVAERKDVLSTFFGILTLWAYACYASGREESVAGVTTARSSEGSNRQVFYGLALIFFALGLMSKPMLVTLPCVLLLLDWWPLGRFKLSSAEAVNPVSRFVPLLIEKIPFLALTVVSGVMTIIAQHRDGIMTTGPGIPLPLRLVNALATLARYVEKTVWPTDLGAIYPFVGKWPTSTILVTVVALVAVTVLALRWMSSRPYWIVGWLWFLGTLVPVLGIFQFESRAMADYYTYVPLIGLFVIIVWDVCDIVGQRGSNALVLGAISAAALVALLIISSQQLKYWRNTGTLLSHVPCSDINALGHAEYAAFLMNDNRLGPAQTECERALRIAPGSALMRALLGRILFLAGNQPQAVTELRAALQMEPALLDARIQLGQALLAEKSSTAAIAELQTAIKAQPGNAQAHYRLGQALMMAHDSANAAAQFGEALRLQPQFPEAHFSLGLLLEEQHKISDAVAQYQAALRLHADYPDALNNLAWILSSSTPPNRNGPQAVQLAQRACELTRNAQPAIIGTLAAAYAAAGRFDEATVTAQKAHDLAIAHGEKELAATNLRLTETYRAHRTASQNAP